MAPTIDPAPAARPDEPPSDEALVERALARLGRLLADDAEVKAARPSPDALRAIRSSPTTIESVATAFELYADRVAFRERAFEIDEAGELRFLPELLSVRYREAWERIGALASGLIRSGLARTGGFVGVCGFGGVDWVVADLACLYLAAVSVPLQVNMSSVDLQQIVTEAELECIVCGAHELELIASVLPECPSVRSVVVMGLREGDRAAEAELSRALETTRVTLRRMSDVEARGRDGGILPMVLPSARSEPDPLMTLMYTSGSTGTPKGAMITERILREQWHSGFFSRSARALPDLAEITVSYMPLNHAAGRGSVVHGVVHGGVTSFVARSDMSTLFEDVRLTRPTTLLLVPRVGGMIHRQFQAEVARRSVGSGDDAERERIAAEVMSEMRDGFLGDRLLRITLGTAPTPPEIVSFLKRCFEVPIHDGYGSTEAGPVTFDGRVAPDVEWRIVDVPELGYRTTDEPYPRGELHVKSRFLVPGYYKNEHATEALFDDEGFLDTGDIVERRGPDVLVWIDRAKNILKLAQGEFVATSRLEGLYASTSRFIRQIFLYGNSLRSYLVAVVVPDLAAAERELGAEPGDVALEGLVRGELHRVAREEELQGYEVPRAFLLERTPFTVESGLLTASNKPARAKLRARYGERLEELYARIERTQVEQLYGLRDERGAPSTAEKVKKAMAVTLGLVDLDVSQAEESYLKLGGDSLSAVGLESLLHDLCGVRVPIGLLLDPTSSIRAVVEHIDGVLAGRTRRMVTFEEVHGAGAKTVRAEDLRIAKFLAPEEIEVARASTPASALPPRAEVALLTGANGFLGRFLALELLEQLAGEGTRLYALVRAPNDASALERLARAYDTDPALARRFEAASAGGRLAVLAGDLMKPRLGLAEEVYARLAGEVDLLVHNGALVNHAFGYAQLFEPNVLGTVEVMRLALAGQRKSIAYVSTVGVLRALDRSVREDEDARSFYTELPTEVGYAAGYSATKWASELLLRDLHDELGVPVTVFRPSGIMAHTSYRGQINAPDFFTRLLAGIVFAGIAPASFYAEGAPDEARHYDGLPVDVMARAIVAPSVNRQGAKGDESYNVVNAHRDDGISLDVIMAWVRSAGYRVERIADYDAWYRTFHDRLVALSEAKRHHSPLAILHAWERPQGERAVLADNALLRARLRAISATLAELPHLSEALIHKTLDDMAALEIIDRPLRVAI